MVGITSFSPAYGTRFRGDRGRAANLVVRALQGSRSVSAVDRVICFGNSFCPLPEAGGRANELRNFREKLVFYAFDE